MNAKLNLMSVAAMVLMLQPAVADDHRADATTEKLQGQWEIIGGVNQGRELTNAEVAGTYVTITTNSIVTYDRSQQEKFRAVFTLDESKQPIQITMTNIAKNAPARKGIAGETPDTVMASGILKFEGKDKWTLCYALPGEERPTQFASPSGSRIMLFHMQKKQGDPVPKLSETHPAK